MLNHSKLILLIIAILGLILRLLSINYGLPYVFGPDEKRQVLDALSMGARHSLLPQEFTYPALHKYLLLFCFSIYFLFGLILRIFSNPADFVFQFLVNPGSIFLIARFLSAFIGIAIIISVYLLGKDFFSQGTAIIASVFTMFMFQLVSHSQWATADILLAFWSTWAFYYVYRCMEKGGRKDFMFSGVFIGLATATKHQGLYLIVSFLVMVLVSARRFIPDKKLLRNSSITFLVMIIFIILGNLGFIFSFKENMQRFLELKHEIMGISSRQPFNHSFISVTGWFTKELIRQETLLAVMLIAGILYAIYKHTRKDTIFLTYLTFCLFSLVPFGFRSLHLLVYSFAIICVFGARFTERLLQIIFKARYVTVHSLVFASLIAVPSIATAIRSDMQRLQPDTRILAKAWIERNIPSGANIAEDWLDFSVSLQSEYPFLFQDEKMGAYYRTYFDEGIKQRYADYSLKTGSYYLIQVRYETPEPVWPEDMPREAVERAKNNPVIKRLYRWFNFRSIAELKTMGIRFVIISSYAYNHFLWDDDPHKKTGLFNPYFLEDTLSSNKQAKSYDKNSRYGLLFYLAKRSRDFYLPLLYLENKDIKIVKEFSPTNNNLGPVIKIYKIGD